jgi:hypothetical protein
VRHHLSSYLADLLLLVGLNLLYFGRLLLPGEGQWAFREGDFTNQFFPAARYAAARLSGGEAPLWSPYVYSGHPFLADVQSAVFYPPRLATDLLSGGVLTQPMLQFEAVGHFVLVALFTYLLTRRLTGSRFGGLVGAVAFTFSGYLTSYPAQQLAVLETVTWLPLILLLIDSSAARQDEKNVRASLGYLLVSGLVWGASLMAGHPQSAMLCSYLVLGFLLYRLWPSRPQPAAFARLAGMTALFLLSGIGIAAVQLLPAAEFMAVSTRASIGFDQAGGGFAWGDLRQLFLPQVANEVPALYLGLLTPGLATTAVLGAGRDGHEGARRRRDIAFFALVAVLGAILMFGRLTPLHRLAYDLAPGWRLFRGQERVVLWVVLGMGVLAAFGAAWLARRWQDIRRDNAELTPRAGSPHPERPAVAGYLAIASLALAAGLVLRAAPPGARGSPSAEFAAWLSLALLALLSAAALASRRRWIVLAVLVLDLFALTSGNLVTRVEARQFAAAQDLLQNANRDTAEGRLHDELALPGLSGLRYGVEATTGISPLQWRAYAEFARRVPLPLQWRLLNVAHVSTWRGAVEVPTRLLGQAPGEEGFPYNLLGLETVAPRAWLAGQVIVETDLEATLERLTSPDFDPQRQVVLSEAVPGAGQTSDCAGDITWLERRPERLLLDVVSGARCILVLSELNYPGWRATVDGAPEAVRTANGILRALAVPPGTHRVELVFAPDSVRLGGTMTTLALVSSALLLAWLVRRSPSRGAA